MVYREALEFAGYGRAIHPEGDRKENASRCNNLRSFYDEIEIREAGSRTSATKGHGTKQMADAGTSRKPRSGSALADRC
jgi:hypothetical protein